MNPAALSLYGPVLPFGVLPIQAPYNPMTNSFGFSSFTQVTPLAAEPMPVVSKPYAVRLLEDESSPTALPARFFEPIKGGKVFSARHLPDFLKSLRGNSQIGFRKTVLATAGGPVTKYHIFQRSGPGAEGSGGTTGVGGSGDISNVTTRPPAVRTVAIDLTANVGALILIHEILILGDIPEEHRLPAVLGTLWTANFITSGGNFMGASSKIGTVLANVPLFATLNVIFTNLLDALGVDKDSRANKYASIGLSLSPFIAAEVIPCLKTALSSSAGVGLVGASQFWKSAFWKNPAGGAGFLGAVTQVLGVIGVALVGDFVAGYTSDREVNKMDAMSRLNNFSWKILIKETSETAADDGIIGWFCSVVMDYAPNLVRTTQAIGMGDDDKDTVAREITSKSESLIRASRKFGDKMELWVMDAAARSVRGSEMSRAQWLAGIQEQFTEGDQRQHIKNAYTLIGKYTGPFAPTALQWTELIQVDGTIPDAEAFTKFITERIPGYMNDFDTAMKGRLLTLLMDCVKTRTYPNADGVMETTLYIDWSDYEDKVRRRFNGKWKEAVTRFHNLLTVDAQFGKKEAHAGHAFAKLIDRDGTIQDREGLKAWLRPLTEEALMQVAHQNLDLIHGTGIMKLEKLKDPKTGQVITVLRSPAAGSVSNDKLQALSGDSMKQAAQVMFLLEIYKQLSPPVKSASQRMQEIRDVEVEQGKRILQQHDQRQIATGGSTWG